MNIFSTLPAGDSTSWLDDTIVLPDGRLADSAGWTLKYYLRGPGSLDVTSTANGSGWKSTVSSTASAALGAGTYAWTAIMTNTEAERVTVGSGQLQITPDLTATSAGFDPLSKAQRALSDCEAAMATFNSTGGKVKKYTIAGRDMEFQTIADLRSLQTFWKTRVLNETRASSIAQGLGDTRNLMVRFNHVQ